MSDVLDASSHDASDTAAQPLLTRTPRDAARVAAYLLRDAVRRIPEGALGRDRRARLARELADCLVPYAVAERSCLGWYRAVCQRFGSDPTGAGHERGYPATAWLPEGRVRWDRALAAVEMRHLRLCLHESPDLFATFATEREPIEGEEALFDVFAFDEAPRTGQALPARLIAPRQYRTVWTQTAPSAHGADEKRGNVSLFRRQRMVDARTGEHALVPFISGNSVRGQWRDRVMGRFLSLIGLKPEDLPARTRAHALLAGGSLDAGADTATVNVEARRRARACCPPWDLLAGCVDSQIMSGAARVNDAVLVCRENAWLVRDAVAPDQNLDAFARELPEAAALTTLRLLTRHAHRDLPEADGSQMLVNTELVVTGARWVHSLSVYRLEGVSEITLACLADLLTDWRDDAYVGAGAARGHGSVAFDPYAPGEGAPSLPDPALYLDWLHAHREEARAWVLGQPDPSAPVVSMGALEVQKKGRGKAPKAPAVAPAEIPFEEPT